MESTVWVVSVQWWWNRGSAPSDLDPCGELSVTAQHFYFHFWNPVGSFMSPLFPIFLLQHFWNPVGKYCLSIGWRIVMTYFFPFLETSPPLQSGCFQLWVIEWFVKTKKTDCKGRFCVQVVSCWSDLPKQRKGIFCNDRFLCQDQTAVDGFKSS